MQPHPGSMHVRMRVAYVSVVFIMCVQMEMQAAVLQLLVPLVIAFLYPG